MTYQVDTERPRFRRPFVVPDSLDDLRGPAAGMVTIPHSVFWAKPGPVVINVEDDRVLWPMYREVLGSAVVLDDLVTVVNKDHLIRLWPRLVWDRVVRQAWESRFPELRGRSEFDN